jgi:hypothetical protein
MMFTGEKIKRKENGHVDHPHRFPRNTRDPWLRGCFPDPAVNFHLPSPAAEVPPPLRRGPPAPRRAHLEHPDFAHHLILKLITRVRSLTGRVKSLALEDVYRRVVALLQATSEPDGEQHRIVTQRMTQQDIAEHVGASREMVSRIFKQLTVGGYVALEGGHIRLLRTPPASW